MWCVNHYPKLILSLMFVALPVLAGPIDPLAPRGDIGSAMYRVEDICQRLRSGAEGELKAFQGPVSGPQEDDGKRCTLTDVMNAAPRKDEMSGAQPSEVLFGKTYWGLRAAEQWGKQTGMMVDQGSKSYTPGKEKQTIEAGYYNGDGVVEGDEDLKAENILKGINLFGVTGNYECPAVELAAVPKTGADNSIGVDLPKPRFTDNTDGTVTDNLTGLIWLKDASCIGSATWNMANNKITEVSNSLNSGYDFICGDYTAGTYNDWRLPSINELQSLVHRGFYNPTLSNAAGTRQWREDDPFLGIQLDASYWSATTAANNTSKAWVVNFYYGLVDSYGKPSTNYSVWPVRGGQ